MEKILRENIGKNARRYGKYTKEQISEKLGLLILRKLDENDMAQIELSREIGAYDGFVNKCLNENFIPNKTLLNKIFSALKVPYKNLEDFMKNY